MKYYRVALMAFFCLAIEQTADSSYLSGKGMGYFMLLGLCMNANLNSGKSMSVHNNIPGCRESSNKNTEI